MLIEDRRRPHWRQLLGDHRPPPFERAAGCQANGAKLGEKVSKHTQLIGHCNLASMNSIFERLDTTRPVVYLRRPTLDWLRAWQTSGLRGLNMISSMGTIRPPTVVGPDGGRADFHLLSFGHR